MPQFVNKQITHLFKDDEIEERRMGKIAPGGFGMQEDNLLTLEELEKAKKEKSKKRQL